MGFLINPYAHGGVVPFDPASISNLTGWWDFSDASSVTLSGSAITQITPQSGASSAMFFQQSDAGFQPSIGTMNGLGAGVFSTDYLKSDGANDANFTYGNDNFTILIAFERAAGASTSQRMLWGQAASASGSNDFLSGFLHDGDNIQFNVVTTPPTVHVAQTTGQDYSTGTPKLAILRRDGTTTEIVALDGSVLATATTTGTSLSPVTPIYLGGLFDPPTSFNEQWTGKIGEALVYRKRVVGTELTDLIAHLVAKWGIS